MLNVTQQQTKEQKMKIDKSSAECASYNTFNAEAIAQGLLEMQEPSDRIVQQEAKDAAEVKAGIIRVTNKLGILQQIWNALPEGLQAVYTLPEIPPTPSNSYMGFKTVSFGPASVHLESFSNDSWGRGHSYYRIVIGSYGDKKIVKLNPELTITPTQVAKVVAKMAEAYAAYLAKQNARTLAAKAQKRRDDWLAVAANNKLAQAILQTSYVGGSDKVAVHEDGRISIAYETYTQQQWDKIAQLTVAHALEMKNLKDSFKAAK